MVDAITVTVAADGDDSETVNLAAAAPLFRSVTVTSPTEMVGGSGPQVSANGPDDAS